MLTRLAPSEGRPAKPSPSKEPSHRREQGQRAKASRTLKASRAGAVLASLAFLAGLPAPAFADSVRDSQRPVLRTLEVSKAWAITRGAGVTVAVLDSGVDATHDDLAGSVSTGKDFTAGANPDGVEPKQLHGTYMASLIAGHGHGPGDQDGVIGVAPEARVLSVRVILEDEEPGFRTFNTSGQYENVVADGIRYAADHGADVINMSISKDFPTEEERAAIRYAISKGVVLVGAAGNDGALKTDKSGFTPYSYPASFPGVISVAAADAGHRRASFSSRNSLVLVSAPGVDVLGAGPGNQYWVGRGTSQATALVSGVVALIRSRYPRLPPGLVAQAVTAGVRHKPSAGYDPGIGFGEVSAAAALEAAHKLAGYRLTAAGFVPSSAFGPARGAIQVVHRDRGEIVAYGGIALLATLGAGASLAAVALIIRKTRSALPSQHNGEIT